MCRICMIEYGNAVVLVLKFMWKAKSAGKMFLINSPIQGPKGSIKCLLNISTARILKFCTFDLQLGTKTASYLLTCRFTIGIIVEVNSIHLWGFVKNWRLLPIKQHSMTLCNLFNALFWGKWRLSKFNFPCSKLLRDLGKLALVCSDDGLQLTIRFLGFNAYWESIMLVNSFDSSLEVQPLSSWMPSSHQLNGPPKWYTNFGSPHNHICQIPLHYEY